MFLRNQPVSYFSSTSSNDPVTLNRVKGGSWVQDPETLELIPRSEYKDPGSTVVDFPTVMNDIKPYKSMVNGEWITSRSRHREHLKDHGCIEVGNDIKYKAPEKIPSSREFIAYQVNKMFDSQ